MHDKGRTFGRKGMGRSLKEGTMWERKGLARDPRASPLHDVPFSHQSNPIESLSDERVPPRVLLFINLSIQ